MNDKLAKIKMLVLDVDGTLTDGGVYITDSGNQFKRFDVKDGLGIKTAMKAGIDVGIISHSHATEMIYTRAEMLGIVHCYVGERPKLEIINEWMRDMGITLEQVAYIGDDINDMEILGAVGFSACPADATVKVKKEVDLVLSLVGGQGCVREFIDEYLLNQTP